MQQRKSPLWMRIHVAEFLSRTTHLTCEQFGAYMRLTLSMFQRDGSLPSDSATLKRVTGAHPPRWTTIWAAIKPLLTAEGDMMTSELVQAELAQAHAKIAAAKMAGRSGGRTTQERNRYGRMGYPSNGFAMAGHKSLKNNDRPQADAKANYNYKNKKQEEGEPLPLPSKSRASGSPFGSQEGEEVVDWARPPQQPTQPECPVLSEDEKARRVDALEDLKRTVNAKD